MKVQYIRVSTFSQKTDRQEIEGVKAYEDICSGSIAFNDRKDAKKLIQDVEDGKVTEIMVHSIDRLGRNTLDIMQTIKYFTKKGINVVSVKEGISTMIDGKENPIAKMIVGILSSLAEFELARIRERQAEGIEQAQKKGRYLGRAKGSSEDIEVFLNKAKTQEIIKNLKQGESIRRTAKLSDASVGLVQKVKKLADI